MDEIVDVRCYEYADELVVELFGRDVEDEVAVVSYGFRLDGDGTEGVRGPDVSPEHADRVEQALRDAGYPVEV